MDVCCFGGEVDREGMFLGGGWKDGVGVHPVDVVVE